MRARRMLFVLVDAAGCPSTRCATRRAHAGLRYLRAVGPCNAPSAVSPSARYPIQGLPTFVASTSPGWIHSGRKHGAEASDSVATPTSLWSFKTVATIPNLLSVARGASGPALAAGILLDVCPELIISGISFAALSDWLDGHLARKWNQRSIAGTYLDPAGDKIFVACVSSALAAKGFIPAWLALLFVSRDMALVGGVSYKRACNLRWTWQTWGHFFATSDRKQGGAKPLPPLVPRSIGKICTTLQFALFVGAMSHHVQGWPTQEDMTLMQYATGMTTALSAVAYYFHSSDVLQGTKPSLGTLRRKGAQRSGEL